MERNRRADTPSKKPCATHCQKDTGFDSRSRYKKMKRIITILITFLLCVFSFAREKKILSFHEDTYAITGPSLRQGTFDIKFQLSLKVYPITINEKWQAFFAYTQTSVWNAYQNSSPFKDNLFRPGVFFENRPDSVNVIRIGLEHRSNGRPYFGNPLASSEVEDYSRGMNYLTASWFHNITEAWQLQLTARAGVGCGVGKYPRHEDFYTQDLFLYYLGYLDVATKYSRGGLALTASVTPIWSKYIANVTVSGTYRFNPKWPAIFAQFHYGFDEALCDCTQGTAPPIHLRLGIVM